MTSEVGVESVKPAQGLPSLTSLSHAFSKDVPIDPALRSALPEGLTVLDACRYVQTTWSFTVKLRTSDENDVIRPFFLKYMPGDLGSQQTKGEFEGMSKLYEAAPDFVTKPIAWGKLEAMQSETYFLIIEFKDFETRLSDPVKLAQRVAAMHKNSVSPTGMFGFPVQTFDGARFQVVDWDPSWTSFFSKLLAEAYRQDCEVNGVWPELDAMYRQIQERIIPRLVGALESDGRSIKPALIHGDMWEGNVGTDSNGDPWIFDCGAYYAHNEMELGIWRAERHELRNKVYHDQYKLHFEPSDPKGEWDDRIRLYSAKTNFMFSACFPGAESRKSVFEDIAYLLRKYQFDG